MVAFLLICGFFMLLGLLVKTNREDKEYVKNSKNFVAGVGSMFLIAVFAIIACIIIMLK